MEPAIAEQSQRGRVASGVDPAQGAEVRGAVRIIPVDGPVFEFADGTELVPAGVGTPARIEDGSRVFTLADALGADAGPFAGYVRR